MLETLKKDIDFLIILFPLTSLSSPEKFFLKLARNSFKTYKFYISVFDYTIFYWL